MKESILELKNISKVFGDVTVIKNVNLEIKKGEFVTFLGPSGCGKTTLLRMIAGFYNIDKGDIFYKERKLIMYLHIKEILLWCFKSMHFFHI